LDYELIFFSDLFRCVEGDSLLELMIMTDWISILCDLFWGAISAGIAFLIVRVATRAKSETVVMPDTSAGTPKKETNKARYLYIVVFCLMFTVGRIFMNTSVIPKLRVWEAEKTLLKAPVYAALKQYDPATYNKMMASMESSLREKKPMATISARMRAYLVSQIPRYLQQASPVAVVAYMRVQIKEIEYLNSKDTEAAFQFVSKGVVPHPLWDQIPINITEEDLKTLGEVIKSAYEAPAPAVGKGTAEPLMNEIFQHMKSAYGENVQLLADPKAAELNKPTYCLVLLAYFNEILSLPSPSNGLVFKYIFAEG
jgi:hypothetical protein